MENPTPLQNPGKLQRWGNYFKEFLMLFLAVFCGFLAENLREERNERETTRTYMKSLLEDVKRDSLELELIRTYHDKNLKKMDSLKNETAALAHASDSRRVYRFLSENIGFPDFMPSDGTFEQLKYDGGLKTIQEKEIIDHLMLYHKKIKRLTGEERIVNDYVIEMNNLNRYFDIVSLENHAFTGTIPLLDGSSPARNDLYCHIQNWRSSLLNLESHRLIVLNEGIILKKTIQNFYPKL